MRSKRRSAGKSIGWGIAILLAVTGCHGDRKNGAAPLTNTDPSGNAAARLASIPRTSIKRSLKDDAYPPILHLPEWEPPIALPFPVNTAGGEDGPFILPDGKTLYFWFTPDVRIPAEKQLWDGVTGMYVSRREGDRWSEPERVRLQDEGEPALDGCLFVQGDRMYFCSARIGNFRGMDIWKAEQQDGTWCRWENAGRTFNVDYQVGELHIRGDGLEMFFSSERKGGKGKRDIWVSRNIGGTWQEPVPVEAVNSPHEENQPYVSEDGSELWFTSDSRILRSTPAVFRSRRTPTGWTPPVEVVSHFVGEPTLDRAGNLYFTHHYFRNGKHLEADICMARKR